MQTYGARGNRTASITFQTYPTLDQRHRNPRPRGSYGACSVEMPQSGVNQAIAATYDSELRANCSVMGIPVPNTPSPNGGTVQTTRCRADRRVLAKRQLGIDGLGEAFAPCDGFHRMVLVDAAPLRPPLYCQRRQGSRGGDE